MSPALLPINTCKHVPGVCALVQHPEHELLDAAALGLDAAGLAALTVPLAAAARRLGALKGCVRVSRIKG